MESVRIFNLCAKWELRIVEFTCSALVPPTIICKICPESPENNLTEGESFNQVSLTKLKLSTLDGAASSNE